MHESKAHAETEYHLFSVLFSGYALETNFPREQPSTPFESNTQSPSRNSSILSTPSFTLPCSIIHLLTVPPIPPLVLLGGETQPLPSFQKHTFLNDPSVTSPSSLYRTTSWTIPPPEDLIFPSISNLPRASS